MLRSAYNTTGQIGTGSNVLPAVAEHEVANVWQRATESQRHKMPTNSKAIEQVLKCVDWLSVCLSSSLYPQGIHKSF